MAPLDHFTQVSIMVVSSCQGTFKDSKNWYTGKVIAYRGYFYFAPNAAFNFLERELGMKGGVSGGQHFLIHLHPWLPN